MQSSPTSLIIFGATGDLMAKRIVPALFYLFENEKLPLNFNVVGVSRRDINDNDFREVVAGIVLKHSRGTVDHRRLDRFLDIFTYSPVTFEEEAGYQKLNEVLKMRERASGKTNRLLYLAVPPKLFPVILERKGFRDIVQSGSTGGLSARVIVEKPFGTDGISAEAMEKDLATCFSEDQIYRVDHYLTKDILQNIAEFRFGNKLFEHNWNKDTIESIRIRLWETMGVENRGNFYDHIGAFRDVGQNHMLEILALLTMEEPETASADEIREKRLEILSALQAPTENEMTKETFRAQHEGYKTIPGVDPGSQTETYFAVRAKLNTPRWSGVPIIMEAGKRMHEARKEIIVTFHSPYQNTVIFRMEPREEVVIEFLSKKPGILESGTEKREFHFKLHETETHTQYVAEYGKMILDAIEGDPKLFVSADEVRATWAFTDPIIAAWEKNLVPLMTYAPDTDEAATASQFIKNVP